MISTITGLNQTPIQLKAIVPYSSDAEYHYASAILALSNEEIYEGALAQMNRELNNWCSEVYDGVRSYTFKPVLTAEYVSWLLTNDFVADFLESDKLIRGLSRNLTRPSLWAQIPECPDQIMPSLECTLFLLYQIDKLSPYSKKPSRKKRAPQIYGGCH